MNKGQAKIVTIILLVMTVGLMLAIFYIGYVLTTNTEKPRTIAPQKTKAQSGSYNKFIALEITPSLTPTPTEIVLAYQNPTPTLSATASGTVTPKVTATITSTKVATLPQSGFITNAIILFGVSALVIFISFIF